MSAAELGSEKKNSLKQFTKRAKELGMRPIFDLVLNHVSSKSPLVEEHLGDLWFKSKSKFRDTKDFNYDGEGYEQIVSFWKEFIDLYMDELGFAGVRIDCARALPKRLRHDIFAYIKEKNSAAIIFEEALFSDLTPQKYYEEQGDVGATHITGSAYYRTIEWHGGFQRQSPIGAPGDANNEEYWKRKMVSGGVVNFTGNHDEYSGAMKVIRELAVERMDQDATYKDLYAKKMAAAFKDDKVSSFLKDQNKGHLKALMDDRKYDKISLKFLYYYIQEIVNELEDTKNPQHSATLKRVTNMVKNNMVVNMFAGSGGYYMLSGDEVGCLRTPSVFMHESGVPMHVPGISSETVSFTSFFEGGSRSSAEKSAFRALKDDQKEQVNEVLNQRVYEYFARQCEAHDGDKLSASNGRDVSKRAGWLKAQGPSQEVLGNRMAGVIGGLKQLDDATVALIRKDLEGILGEGHKSLTSLMKLVGKEAFIKYWFVNAKTQTDYTPEAQWGTPKALGTAIEKEFIKDLNEILEKLPKSEHGFWSEIFLWHMDEAPGCVVVRKNGEGYGSRTDVVVVGYDAEKVIMLEEKFFLKDLPSWIQGRGFPDVKPGNTHDAPQGYHEVYNASLPENNTVHLYVGRDVEVSDGVKSLKGVEIHHYEPRPTLRENLKPTEEIIETGESTDNSREKGNAVIGADEGQGKGGFSSRFKKQAGSHLEREGSRRAHGEGHSGFGSSK
jgi:hypothetical protein